VSVCTVLFVALGSFLNDNKRTVQLTPIINTPTEKSNRKSNIVVIELETFIHLIYYLFLVAPQIDSPIIRAMTAMMAKMMSRLR